MTCNSTIRCWARARFRLKFFAHPGGMNTGQPRPFWHDGRWPSVRGHHRVYDRDVFHQGGAAAWGLEDVLMRAASRALRPQAAQLLAFILFTVRPARIKKHFARAVIATSSFAALTISHRPDDPFGDERLICCALLVLLLGLGAPTGARAGKRGQGPRGLTPYALDGSGDDLFQAVAREPRPWPPLFLAGLTDPYARLIWRKPPN